MCCSGDSFNLKVQCHSSPRRQCDIAIEVERSVIGIRPRNNGVQVFDDLPLREEPLCLLCIGKLERPQDEAFGVKLGSLDSDTHCDSILACIYS